MVNIEEIKDDNLLEQKIYGLPGYEINNRLTRFVNAILCFQGNGNEILTWYRKLNDPQTALILWNPENSSILNKTNIEMQRIFSNYLMSAFAVRDHWYAIRNEYYANTKALEDINELTNQTFNQSELSQFMHDFRNYVTHKGYPKVSSELAFDTNILTNDIYFDKEQLLEFHKWDALSKKYIERIAGRIKLIDLVKEYTKLINTYYEGVIKILVNFHKVEIEELQAYKKRYGLRIDIVRIDKE